MAELLTELNPKLYRIFVTNEKWRTVLYMDLNKSLYGTLQAALLFWRNLTPRLQEWGFEIYPYNWCVVNKTVNGNQMRVVWHVDDPKTPHENGDTVDALIRKLNDKYGKEADPTTHRGNVHEFMGMKIDYREQGKVKTDMTDYLKKNPERPARQVSRQSHPTGGKPPL